MALLTLILTVIYLINSSDAELCNTSGYDCVSPYQYQLCMNFRGSKLALGPPTTCPQGHICSASDFFPCKVGVITTTLAPTTQITCSGPSKFPAPLCNQYYECGMIWFQWTLHLKTCPDGNNYDKVNGKCVSAELVNCGGGTSPNSPVVTTPSPPKCTGPGKFKGPQKNQYYECQMLWFQWTTQLRTCPDNEIFDEAAGKCTVEV